MSDSTEVSYAGPTVPATTSQNESTQLMNLIMKAAADERVDVVKMTALVELQERVLKGQREAEFNAAMARLQSKLPPIQKDGTISGSGGAVRSRYARLETIDAVIRPLLAEEGFSFSFNEESADANNRTYSAKLAHKSGHSETKLMTLPIDVNQHRTSIQNAGSTNAYARRYLIKMHLNLIEVEEDRDGARLEYITKDQAKDIDAVLTDLKADKAAFLRYLNIRSLEEMPLSQLKQAHEALEQKRRKQ